MKFLKIEMKFASEMYLTQYEAALIQLSSCELNEKTIRAGTY